MGNARLLGPVVRIEIYQGNILCLRRFSQFIRNSSFLVEQETAPVDINKSLPDSGADSILWIPEENL
jgi:hypothetical protein